MKTLARLLIGAAVLGCAPVAAQSPPQIAGPIAAGQVGERYDGYMGAVGAVSPEVRRQVAAINLRRRNLYIGLASERHVAAQSVGLATGCELIGRLSAGEAYMLQDGAWRRRVPGQAVPLPDYCH
jgi:uncharacterized protein YdbL (DUF1318 family)